MHSRHRSQLTIRISMGGTRPQCLGHSSGNAKDGWRVWRVCRHPSRNRPEHFSSGQFLHIRRQSQLATRVAFETLEESCLSHGLLKHRKQEYSNEDASQNRHTHVGKERIVSEEMKSSLYVHTKHETSVLFSSEKVRFPKIHSMRSR